MEEYERRPGRGNARPGQGRSSGQGGRPGTPRPVQMGEARRRMLAARKRKRIRQRRMVLCGLFLLLAAMIGGTAFGVVRYRNLEERRAVVAEGAKVLDQGDYEAAIGYFDQAVALADGKVGGLEIQALLFRAEAEYMQEDYAAALHTYQILLEQDPENSTYQRGAVLCMAETGDYEEALKFETAQGRVYSRIARDQIKAGQYDEALASIAQGRNDPDQAFDKELDYNEAVIWEYKGDYAKALELFEAYASKYGDGQADREITFLKSRQGNP